MSKNGLATWKPFTPSIFDAFDDLFVDRFDRLPTTRAKQWVFEKDENGGTLTINALGHNPENIEIEVINSKLTIKSKRPDNASELMSDVDYNFTIPSKYSEKDIKASFNNGMVTIKFGITEEAKPKRIKLDY